MDRAKVTGLNVSRYLLQDLASVRLFRNKPHPQLRPQPRPALCGRSLTGNCIFWAQFPLQPRLAWLKPRLTGGGQQQVSTTQSQRSLSLMRYGAQGLSKSQHVLYKEDQNTQIQAPTYIPNNYQHIKHLHEQFFLPLFSTHICLRLKRRSSPPALKNRVNLIPLQPHVRARHNA